MVAELALIGDVRQPYHQALSGGHVGKHLGEKILYHLKGRDRFAELQSLLSVFERCLERAHLDAGRGPTHHVPRHSQHPRGIPERVATLQAICFRNSHVLERNLAVLDHFQRNLVLDLFDAEAGRGFVLDDEALDLIVGDIPRPDDRKVAPGRVPNPALLVRLIEAEAWVELGLWLIGWELPDWSVHQLCRGDHSW